MIALLLAVLGNSPFVVPPPQNTISTEVSLTEGFEATGDFDTKCGTASTRGDLDGIQACGPLTDVAAAAMNISAQSAAPLGSGSTTGANVVIRPGSGTHKAVMTAASWVNATTTFTLTVDGTALTGTEGTAFECNSVTDTVCANNVANYYEGLAGAAGIHACSSGSTTTCTAFGFTGVAGTVYFFPAPEDSPGKFIDLIACSTGAAATLTNGTNGQMELPGGTLAVPSLTFNGDSDLGLYRSSANTLGLAGGLTVSAALSVRNAAATKLSVGTAGDMYFTVQEVAPRILVNGNVFATMAFSAGSDLIAPIGVIYFCGEGPNGATTVYLSPHRADLFGSANCKLEESTTEATADEVWAPFDFTVGQMECGITDAAVDAGVTFAFRDDTADASTDLTCTTAALDGAGFASCADTDTTPPVVSAGSAIAVRVVAASGNLSAADVWCRVATGN